MRRFLVVCASVLAILTLIFLMLVVGVIIYSKSNSLCEVDEELFDRARLYSSTSYYTDDGNGQLTEVWRDGEGGVKAWYSFSEISDNLKNGFISSEDRGFYEHSGVDLKRTAMALLNTFLHIKPRFGASTITQQLIKNLSGDNEITLKRKLNEIIRAYNLENHHSKEEIFELYLNIVPMANNIYGVGAASEFYFGKQPSQLTVSEAALLVGIINSPAKYDPIKHPTAALEKRNKVLYAMLDNGVISKSVYEESKSQPLGLSVNRNAGDTLSPMPWYVESAYNEIIEDVSRKYSVSSASARMLVRGSKIILNQCSVLQNILDSFFENKDNLPTEASSGLKYAMVVIDNSTGNTVAMIGGAGVKGGDKILDFTNIPIVPGSTLKPIALYAPLVDSGIINPATVFDDVPIGYKEEYGTLVGYPKNSPNVYEGLISLYDAVAYSKNTVAVSVYNTLGASSIVNTLRNSYGFKTIKDSDFYESPLALGQLTYGVTLRELTRAYTAFPREGVISDTKLYSAVYKKDGSPLITYTPDSKRILSVGGARAMNQLLMGVVERGTARSIDLKYYIDTAGKTGTSGGSLDKVFVGYTPYYTIGIWSGYADGKTPVTSLYPSHLKIWDDVALQIHRAMGVLDEPIDFSTDGLKLVKFDRISGRALCDNCNLSASDVITGYFLPFSLPEKCECESRKEKDAMPA